MSKLSPREQRLLALLGVVAAGILFIGAPVYMYASLAETRDTNDGIRKLLARMDGASELLAQRKQQQDALQARFLNPAPELGTFIEKMATSTGLEAKESKNRPDVVGKQYTERVTVVKLGPGRVGLKPLVQMLEKIKRSNHPVSISKLNLRIRSPDQYDVELAVSAYDKKDAKTAAEDSAEKKPANKKSGATKGQEL